MLKSESSGAGGIEAGAGRAVAGRAAAVLCRAGGAGVFAAVLATTGVALRTGVGAGTGLATALGFALGCTAGRLAVAEAGRFGISARLELFASGAEPSTEATGEIPPLV